MTVQIPLPPGCRGFNMTDGTSYHDRGSGTVTVEDHHAPYIRRQVGGDAGLVGHGSFRSFMATKAGRWCPVCHFLANAWSRTCPRCERRGVTTATVPEAEMPAAGPSLMPSACVVPIAPEG